MRGKYSPSTFSTPKWWVDSIRGWNGNGVPKKKKKKTSPLMIHIYLPIDDLLRLTLGGGVSRDELRFILLFRILTVILCRSSRGIPIINAGCNTCNCWCIEQLYGEKKNYKWENCRGTNEPYTGAQGKLMQWLLCQYNGHYYVLLGVIETTMIMTNERDNFRASWDTAIDSYFHL